MSPRRRCFHRDNTEEQVELNPVDNGDQVIPMENGDINNIVDDDGTNRLIHDIYNYAQVYLLGVAYFCFKQ